MSFSTLKVASSAIMRCSGEILELLQPEIMNRTETKIDILKYGFIDEAKIAIVGKYDVIKYWNLEHRTRIL